jgi:hypothetical protein
MKMIRSCLLIESFACLVKMKVYEWMYNSASAWQWNGEPGLLFGISSLSSTD